MGLFWCLFDDDGEGTRAKKTMDFGDAIFVEERGREERGDSRVFLGFLWGEGREVGEADAWEGRRSVAHNTTTTHTRRRGGGGKKKPESHRSETEARQKFFFCFLLFYFWTRGKRKTPSRREEERRQEERRLEGRMDGGDVPVSREDAPWNQKATKQKASQEDGWVFFIVV